MFITFIFCYLYTLYFKIYVLQLSAYDNLSLSLRTNYIDYPWITRYQLSVEVCLWLCVSNVVTLLMALHVILFYRFYFYHLQGTRLTHMAHLDHMLSTCESMLRVDKHVFVHMFGYVILYLLILRFLDFVEIETVHWSGFITSANVMTPKKCSIIQMIYLVDLRMLVLFYNLLLLGSCLKNSKLMMAPYERNNKKLI